MLNKETFVCSFLLFLNIILLLLPGGAGGVNSIIYVNNFMEQEGRCDFLFKDWLVQGIRPIRI